MKPFTQALLATLLLAAGPSYATPITTAGDPALAGSTLVNFTGITGGPYSSLTIGALTITGGFTIDSSGNCVYSGNSAPCLINAGGALTFTFSNPMTAFGLQIGATNFSQNLTAYNAFNGVIETVVVPNQVSTMPFPYSAFYGINAGSASIQRFTLQANSGDYWSIDNIRFTAGATSVPEPASLALVGVALLGLGWSRRKQA
ncbi:PEP-CTERM sorting domain-containing protein [Rubrivivax rivuli]|uniref:PEP-CTERM sorting domain-containing protein n=1 Tax=Rubrivivax rivuli TaxID=1862385 RepID=A0A437RAV6_9BURK|nr:PEP-CTERM sorting domain-containing protein [Rubrivivax rivuli]RVU43817.1 PEP-CTERM sorting domain-containing protein [Rubrivivax rivuli]